MLMEGMEVVSADEWMRTLGLSILEKRRMEGDFLALYRHLRRDRREGRADDFFSLLHNDRVLLNSSPLH